MQIAKRTEGRHKTDIGTKDLYNFYKNNLIKVESLAGGMTLGSYDITQTLYNSILTDINNSIFDMVIKDNFEFKIPCQLGLFSVKQKKMVIKLDEKGELVTKYMAPDWKGTKILWQNDPEAAKAKVILYHTNEHTNNNKMYYEWSKKKSFTMGIKAYYFTACREKKRYLNQCLKEDNKLQFYEPIIRK